MRYLHLAVFDSRETDTFKTWTVISDQVLLLTVIVPMFIIGLRFWTAPAYLAYPLKINSFVVPVGCLAIFLSQHFDIMFLSIEVTLMNFYVYWYHIDPPVTQFAGGKYTTRRPRFESDSDDDGYKHGSSKDLGVKSLSKG